MKVSALVLISGLLMVSNVFAAQAVLNAKTLSQAITNAHQRSGADKGSFVIVYGGQDISRGNAKVMSTLDQTVLAG
jgi:hypothetical protein